ncbi:hypothetical protein AZ66_09420 [Paenibacillus sp. E194]|uniref:hypothetical protein n=1 Tax=Paenibacillus sp. E194 TaxID=1458845 RepID=UPI0005C946C4|nr:hypothetical protein [Paenibacillus sp. E194]KJB88076.1 hypothetical protein AZ66_09420 [Paenibacillus sp. E194]
MILDLFHRVKEIDIIYQYLAIFIIALIPFLEAHVAVPVGILLNLPAIPTIVLGIVGNWLSVMAIVMGSAVIRARVATSTPTAKSLHHRRFQKAQRYFHSYEYLDYPCLDPLLELIILGCSYVYSRMRINVTLCSGRRSV